MQVDLPFAHKLFEGENFLWLVAEEELRGLACACWLEDVDIMLQREQVTSQTQEMTLLTASKEIRTSFLQLQEIKFSRTSLETDFFSRASRQELSDCLPGFSLVTP